MEDDIRIVRGTIPSREELLKLYGDAGWSAYTADVEKLERALQQSTVLFTAWDGAVLVGLLRAVGDGETIMYVQDLLVLSAFRRRGIGRELLQAFMSRYRGVRQKVLLADTTPQTGAFYTACGFVRAERADCVAFVCFSG